MRIINTSVCAFQNKVLVIGFEGENERTQVRIDASEVFTEYPNAAPSLTVKPNSGEAYPVLVNRDGTDVVWDITSSYLTERGESEIQLTFIKDSVVCKSYIGKALVLRSLTVEGEMPTPVESWVDAANAKLAEVDSQIIELEGMVDTATDAATHAEQSASTASAKAEQAAASAATATEKATEATNAAGTTTAKAAEAQTAAQTATEKANAAAESERIATAKAGEATTAAGTATTKAEHATEAAQTATEKAGEASASATAAHASAIDAEASATAASASETAAKASETAAEASATQAATSAQTANTAAQTATQKAGEASQSATNAVTSAETASTKAGEAAQSAQAVEETAEQLADSLEQIAQNTADIAEHEQAYNALKAATLIHNTASGSIASFVDGAEMPVDEVTMQINPVQDLHGYDNPWPGGGGENVLDPNLKFTAGTYFGGAVLSTQDGYNISLSGTPTESGNITTNMIAVSDAVVMPAGTYTSVGGIFSTYKPDGSWYTNRRTGTWTADSDFIVRQIYIQAVANTPMSESRFICLVKGSTAPTEWTPYANICPISGFDGLTATRTGKNLIDVQDRTLVTEGYIINQDISFPPSQYTLSYLSTTPANHGDVACTGKDEQRCTVSITHQDSKIVAVIDAPSGIENLRVYNGAATYTNIQLELGSTASDFEPYAGNTYDITLPTEAGTVYGGSLTIAEDGSGVLTVNRAMMDMGSMVWNYNTTYAFFTSNSISTRKIGVLNVWSDMFKTMAVSWSGTPVQNALWGNGSNTTLYVQIPPLDNVNDFMALVDGHQLMYELATPTTYTLTAAQITTLLGENNLWHDANGDISVGYKANTKLYVDGKIAELVARIVNS